jgi:hypothetical protein
MMMMMMMMMIIITITRFLVLFDWTCLDKAPWYPHDLVITFMACLVEPRLGFQGILVVPESAFVLRCSPCG